MSFSPGSQITVIRCTVAPRSAIAPATGESPAHLPMSSSIPSSSPGPAAAAAGSASTAAAAAVKSKRRTRRIHRQRAAPPETPLDNRPTAGDTEARAARGPRSAQRGDQMLSNVRVAALLPTTDLEAAKEFYGNTLGLKLLPIEGPVVYEAGAGSTLELLPRSEPTK